MDWMAEQGYQVEWLNPEEYKTWRDLIRDGGGPDNFIDYLVETGRLSKS
jgi:cobalamin biosynthesis Mg chelatase CobN